MQHRFVHRICLAIAAPLMAASVHAHTGANGNVSAMHALAYPFHGWDHLLLALAGGAIIIAAGAAVYRVMRQRRRTQRT